MTVTSGRLLKGQAALPQAKVRARLVRATLAAALALSGCSGVPDLFHRMEGGQIARPRQPPPSVNQPYPNLASVPSRPAPPDAAELARVYQSLVADRENARHLTTALPRPDPSLPSASPELFGLGTAPPPAEPKPSPPPPQPATATLAAASGPAPEPPPAAPSTPPPQPRAAPVSSSPAAPAAPPEVPATPPPRAEPAPAAPPPRAAPPPPAPPAPANAVSLAFEPGSAVLPAPAAEALRALARRRDQRAIAVVGYGDADSADPDAQSKALALGLQRAQAMAQALAADGVPQQSVRLEAQAGGRGGSARIIE
jgi:outer membrane protein OmpA-like peptidoglycan-associated protein